MLAVAKRKVEAPEPPDRRLLALPVAVTVIAAFVYALTLGRTVPAGDSGELIAAAWVGGVAHPPGYPVFTMVGWLATHLVPVSPALVMNALSALWHALTVGALTILVARLVEPSWPGGKNRFPAASAGGIAGLALALSPVFWLYSLVAEVFPLNDLFGVLLLLLAIEWYRNPERTRLIWGIGLVAGLGLAHQQTIVTLAPGVAVLFVGALRRAWTSRDRSVRASSRRHLAMGVGLGVLGLCTYLYLPLAASADPVVNWGDPDSPGRFIEVVARQSYGTFDLVAGGERGSAAENLGLYLADLWRAFTPIGVVIALAGVVWLWRRYRVEAWALLLAWFVAGPVFVLYARAPLDDPVTVGILERFYLLSSVVVALFLGVGVFWIVRVLRPRALVSIVTMSALVAGIGALTAARWGGVDQSDNRVADTYARDVLDELPDDALLLMRGDENFTSVGYMQFVEGLRPDVVAADTELMKLPNYVRDLERRHPGFDVPFDDYAEPDATLVELVGVALPVRRVFKVGVMPEDLTESFDVVKHGLVQEIIERTEKDEYGALLSDPSIVTSLEPQEDVFPDSTWENAILSRYGSAYFDLAFAYQSTGTGTAEQIEDLYRKAIAFGEIENAYKNLGVLKLEQGDRAEAARLFTRYLELNPDDPEATEIQRVIDSAP